jgi:hypothetical protein
MRRTSVDANLDKITDISYQQTFWGARLGFGDLVIATASSTPVPMPELRDANEFKKAIMVAQEDMVKSRAASIMAAQGTIPAAAFAAASTATPTAAAVPVTPVGPVEPVAALDPVEVTRASTPAEITATLASLTDMKEDGTITEADFEAKKKELLERL